MTIRIVCGDLTTFDGDAIVNAANSMMLGGGGVDGAVHRAAGPGLKAACEHYPLIKGALGLGHGGVPTDEVRCPVGKAIPTPSFDLDCNWIIHTVAPLYDVNALRFGGQEGAHLALQREIASCFIESLSMAGALGCDSIAFPALGCGVYQWTHETVARIALSCVKLMQSSLDVTFYLFPADAYPIWIQVAKDLGVVID